MILNNHRNDGCFTSETGLAVVCGVGVVVSGTDRQMSSSSGERLRAGGDSDSSEVDGHSPLKQDDHLMKLLKKIEVIENKVKYLLKKASKVVDAEDADRSEEADQLRSQIKKYRQKLASCEEKRKRFDRVSKRVPSIDVGASSAGQFPPKPVKFEHKPYLSRGLDASKFLQDRGVSGEPRAIELITAANHWNTYDMEGGGDDEEDRICQKMHNAAFKKYSLQNMVWVYTRYRTNRYYNSGVLAYVEVEHKGLKRVEVKLNLPMGKYHYRPYEVRFKRMDAIHRSHMIYYSYRSGQQLCDRIVLESSKIWFPKRFYMPYDYHLDTSQKSGVKVLMCPREMWSFNEQPPVASLIHSPPSKCFHSYIFKPICIPIPKGTKQEVQITSRVFMTDYGETHFHNLEFIHLMVRYTWGSEDIWCSTGKYLNERRPLTGNFFRDFICWQGPIHTRCVVNMMFFYQFKATWQKSLLEKHDKGRIWNGYILQGINVKLFDKLSQEREFRVLYKRWGRMHSDWDIPNKRKT